MYKFRPRPSLLFLLLALLALPPLAGMALSACASRAPVADPPGTAADPGAEQVTLSQSLQEGLTGLAFEPKAEQERLEREAKALLDARKGRAAGAATRRLRVDACRGDEPTDAYEAAFCRLWFKSAGIRPPRAKRTLSLSRTAAGRKRLRELQRSLIEGRIDRMASATDSEIYEALKKGPKLPKLRPAIDKALEGSACAPAALLTGLGLKTEEAFPDPEFKELAQALYQRSAECGQGPEAVKSAYRLGLLQIWDQRYAQAEKTLAQITDNPAAGDYRSRVVYWRYFCAKQTGDSGLQDRMKDILAKEYHLSLHGLITVGPKPTDNHPRVSFRSLSRPHLNAPVRVAEALLEQGGAAEAVDALDVVMEEISGAEPSFQLYVGLVFMRAGDSLRKFKLLTGLYRDYPGLISRESLGMLFPLNRFEVVRKHEQKADPFLMISLIRQESAFNERARSPVGARGLMQLMPRTARRMERVSTHALYDPHVNIRLGVRFFSRLSERYGGEAELALAAYNAGPDNVDTWRERYPVANRLLFVDLIPFRETREYVASIARNYYWYKKLYEASEREPATSAAQNAPTPQEKYAFFKLFDT